MFMNSHVSLKSFHMFLTLYPEIKMLGEISKPFRFMETHVGNHFNPIQAGVFWNHTGWGGTFVSPLFVVQLQPNLA